MKNTIEYLAKAMEYLEKCELESPYSNSVDINGVESGFFVGSDQVVSFLEKKLTDAGLSSKEQADFITFWGPKLAQNELNFVHFIYYPCYRP